MKLIPSGNKLPLLFLIGLSLAPLFDLFYPGLLKTHDGQDHVARIANFYLNLTEGNLIPRWAPNLNWGYGHPILMFLYPFPSYFASLFHFLGFSLVDSVKLVFGVSFIFSGLSMYLFAKSFFNRYAGFVAAMVYMFAPYRFVDLYVRGAIGEHVAFIFPPLIFYFLFRMTKSSSPWNTVLGSLSLAGLILSHNAISLMFLPLILLFIGYLIWQSKRKQFILFQSILLIGFGFLLSGFFWLPAFMEGKYTLRDIVTENEYASRFEIFSRFLYSPWNYNGTNEFSVQIGIVQWLFVIAVPFVLHLLYKKKKNLFVFGLGLFILFWLTLLIMMKVSLPLYEVITTLQKFQFPWRFLTLTVFITSLISGFVVFFFPKKIQVLFLIGVTGGLLLANRNYWHATSYLNYPERFYTSIYNGTTDTGESAPIWSVRFMLERPKKASEVVEGDALISHVSRNSTSRKYTIDARLRSRIRENTLYFPGWNVYVDGKPVSIEFQDPRHRGLMTFYVDQGKHDVNVRFEETKLRLFANVLSFSSVIILFLLISLQFRRVKKVHQ